MSQSEVATAILVGPIDLVSHSTGEMRKRYGFIFVDKYDYGAGDYSRFKKGSFEYYKRIIASNGDDLGWSPFR